MSDVIAISHIQRFVTFVTSDSDRVGFSVYEESEALRDEFR